MSDELVNQLAVQVAQLRGMIEELAGLIQDSEGDSMDDLFLRIGEGSVGEGGDSGAFQFDGDKITHCHFYAAHQVIELDDVTVGKGQADGTWYLNVDHAALESATVSKTAGENDDDHTSIKLFTIEDGVIKKDYRGMPFIPIYA